MSPTTSARIPKSTPHRADRSGMRLSRNNFPALMPRYRSVDYRPAFLQPRKMFVPGTKPWTTAVFTVVRQVCQPIRETTVGPNTNPETMLTFFGCRCSNLRIEHSIPAPSPKHCRLPSSLIYCSILNIEHSVEQACAPGACAGCSSEGRLEDSARIKPGGIREVKGRLSVLEQATKRNVETRHRRTFARYTARGCQAWLARREWQSITREIRANRIRVSC